MTVVGLGTMGRRHARVLGALAERFELVGAYDLRHEADLAPGVEALGSAEEAIARSEVVVVATPIEEHARIVSGALSQGRHVLVEKPLCATALEAQSLVRATRRAGSHLFVAHSERFNPVVRALSRLVSAPDVVSIDMRRLGPCRPANGGVLVNLGVHDFDLAAYLGGGPVQLRGALGPAGGPYGEDFAHVLFATGQAAVGHLYVDRTCPVSERAIVLMTRDWVYEGDLLSHRLVRYARGSRVRTDVPIALEEPLLVQAVALADALDGRAGAELATGADGALAVALAERAAAMFVVAAPCELRSS